MSQTRQAQKSSPRQDTDNGVNAWDWWRSHGFSVEPPFPWPQRLMRLKDAKPMPREPTHFEVSTHKSEAWPRCSPLSKHEGSALCS